MISRFQVASRNRCEFIITTSEEQKAVRAAGVIQGICLWEFDGPRRRSVQVRVLGSAGS